MNKVIMILLNIIILTGIFLPNTFSKEFSDEAVDRFLESWQNVSGKLLANLKLPHDAGLNISEFLNEYGYPFESHNVITEDGYILVLHRIPSGRNEKISSSDESPNPAALFVAGLGCSGFDWVNAGSKRSLGLIMADLGYDVWLLNERGTRYSMHHKTLKRTQKEFWSFSFHEIGYYDLAATIDYILNATGLQNLTVIGHSQGTTSTMVLTTTRPEYNKKINLAVFLSPVGYMGGVRSPLVLLLTKFLKPIELALDAIKLYALPYSEWISKIIQTICSAAPKFCGNFLGLLCGYDKDEVDLEFMMVFLADKPSGISTKQLLHYGQEIKSATFRQYDYGLENIFHYGTITPPNYNLSRITAPVAAYYSKNDFFSAISDVEKLLKQIPNKTDAYLIDYEYFSHLDFIFAKEIRELLYDRVLSVIQQCNPVKKC